MLSKFVFCFYFSLTFMISIFKHLYIFLEKNFYVSFIIHLKTNSLFSIKLIIILGITHVIDLTIYYM